MSVSLRVRRGALLWGLMTNREDTACLISQEERGLKGWGAATIHLNALA